MKVFGGIVSAVGTAALVFVLFAAGYFACSQPITTHIFSQNTSNYESSPYALDDLNALAMASRDFTVDARPAGTTIDDARIAFNQTLMNAATHSATRYLNVTKDDSNELNQQKKELWTEMMSALGDSRPNDAFGKEDVNAVADKMAATSDRFALDEDAFRHLNDCNELINRIVPLVGIAGIIALCCLLVLLVLRQWRWIARMLTIAPLILIIAFEWMGTWAFLDFGSFFTAFHGVFFPQGNWTFSYDSLLICMYPTAFWMGMGALWLATTALASIIVLLFGRSFAGIADRKGQ